MIIVLEGCDGTGKTTLAKALVGRGFEVVHNGPPPKRGSLFEHYTRQLRRVRRGQDVVFDRLHLGELVYGPVMREGSRLTWPEAWLLNRLLFGMGGLLVKCQAPLDWVLDGWKKRRPQEYVDGQLKVLRVVESYERLFSGLQGSRVAAYHVDQYAYVGGADHYAQLLLNFRRDDQNLARHGAVGDPKARYLILGELANSKLGLAFYATDNSSRFLNEALWAAGYEEPELLFANAFTQRGRRRNLKVFMERQPSVADPDAKPRTVIALGQLAQQVCEEQGVPHHKAPHPQYWKRFHGKDRQGYVDLLRSFKEKDDEAKDQGRVARCWDRFARHVAGLFARRHVGPGQEG